MELIVFGILLSLTFSAVQGATPKCCVDTTKKLSLEILQKVTKYDVQTRHGVCSINALVLYASEKRYCATPRIERLLQFVLKRRMKNDVKSASAV
uniref:Chemokine interleukin-8-like domain-containing protein n=1 Tax=Cyprinus carpio TaxID=7962 RepID=A0A8C2JN57_CYPCA